MLAVLAGSGIVASHQRGDTRVQDAYSLRCAPQVIGASRDTLDHARLVVEHELASAIDNPVVLPDGEVASCGNFHGAPLAYVADFLAIALADLASIAERRIDRQLDPARSHGLPAFLAADPGVDSGLMLAQYTAAALVADCRAAGRPRQRRQHPDIGHAGGPRVDGLGRPSASCAGSIDNAVRVVAIEVMTAARAIDLRRPLQPAAATAAVVDGVRQVVPGPGPDRYLAPEIDRTADLVRSGQVLAWAESVTGPLK